jgi:hypothetical protein
MAALTFHVETWTAWRGAPGGGEADAAALPASLRRRVGSLGRQALAAAWKVMPDPAPRFVFSSRHGEYDRTLRLLETLIADGEVSPADFSLSVHHGLAGLLSIATGNHEGHTAIAAGPDSFGYGLLDAAACAAETPDRPVLLVHFDEPLPPLYRDALDDDEQAPVAVALALRAAGEGTALSIEAEPSEDGRRGVGLAAAFIDFLASSDREAAAAGGRMTWRWRRV